MGLHTIDGLIRAPYYSKLAEISRNSRGLSGGDFVLVLKAVVGPLFQDRIQSCNAGIGTLALLTCFNNF